MMAASLTAPMFDSDNEPRPTSSSAESALCSSARDSASSASSPTQLFPLRAASGPTGGAFAHGYLMSSAVSVLLTASAPEMDAGVA